MHPSKMKLTHRVLALALALVLVMGMVPVTAFAADGFTFTVTDTRNGKGLYNMQVNYTLTVNGQTGEKAYCFTNSKGVATLPAEELSAALEKGSPVTVSYTALNRESVGTQYEMVSGTCEVTSLTGNEGIAMTPKTTPVTLGTVRGEVTVKINGTELTASNSVSIVQGEDYYLEVSPKLGYELYAITFNQGGSRVDWQDSYATGYSGSRGCYEDSLLVNAYARALPKVVLNQEGQGTVKLGDTVLQAGVNYFEEGEYALSVTPAAHFTLTGLTGLGAPGTAPDAAGYTGNVTVPAEGGTIDATFTRDPYDVNVEVVGEGKVYFESSSVEKMDISDGMYMTTTTGKQKGNIILEPAAGWQAKSPIIVRKENGSTTQWSLTDNISSGQTLSEGYTLKVTFVDMPPEITDITHGTEWAKEQVVTWRVTDNPGDINAVYFYPTPGEGEKPTYDETTRVTANSDGLYEARVTANGRYTIYVVDNAAKNSSQEIQVTNIDTEAPEVLAVEGTGGDWAKSVTVLVTPGDNAGGSGVKQVYCGQSQVYTEGGPNPMTLRGDGKYEATVWWNETYFIWVVDNAGNVSDSYPITINNIDRVAPTVEIEPEPTGWAKGSVDVTVTVTDLESGPDSTLQYWQEGQETEVASLTLDENGQTTIGIYENSGSYKYYFRATDQVGNTETKTLTLQFDQTKPTVTVDEISSEWTNESVTVTGTASDEGGSGVAGVFYTTDQWSDSALHHEAVYDSKTGKYSFTVDENGSYYIYSVDGAGNKSGWATAFVGNIDKTAPGTPVLQNGNALTQWYPSGQQALLSFQVEDNTGGSGIESLWISQESVFATDTATKATQNGYKQLEVGQNGTYYIWAMDEAGNRSEEPAAVTLSTFVQEPPTVALQDYDENAWHKDSVTVHFQAEDKGGSGYGEAHYWIEGGGEQTATIDAEGHGSFTLSRDRRNGSYTYHLYVTDKAGNRSQTVDFTVKFDGAAPTVKLNVYNDAPSNIAATFDCLANDKYEGSELSGVVRAYYNTTGNLSDGVTDVRRTGNGVYGLTVSENGAYYIWAEDQVGNISSPLLVNVTNIDRAAPTMSFDTTAGIQPDGENRYKTDYASGTVTVTVNAVDEAVGNNAASGVGRVCYRTADQKEYTVLEKVNGAYAFEVPKGTGPVEYEVFAQDRALNLTRQWITVYRDDTAPTLTATPDKTGWTNGSVTVTLDVSDAHSGIREVYYRDSRISSDISLNIHENKTSTHTIGAADFQDTVSFYAIDNAGNRSEVVTVELKQDVTKPVVQVVDAPNGWTKEGVTVKVAATDGGAGVKDLFWSESRVTAYDPESCTHITLEEGGKGQFAIPNDTNVNKTLYVYAVDGAGNVSVPVTVDVKIDIFAPSGWMETQEKNWYSELLEYLTFGLYHKEELTVRISSSDGFSGVASVQYYIQDKTDSTPMKLEDLKKLEESQWTDYNEDTGVVLTPDRAAVVYGKVTDRAGNATYFSSDGLIVENKGPEVTIDASATQPNGYGYCTEDVILHISAAETVSAGNVYSGLKSVTYKVFKDYREEDAAPTQEGALFTFKNDSPAYNDLVAQWGRDSAGYAPITVDSQLNNSDYVRVEVTATDNAGNSTTVTRDLKINVTPPTLTVTVDGQVQGEVRDNDGRWKGYYGAGRTMTLTLTDRASTFDPDGVGIAINAKDAKGQPVEDAYTVSEWVSVGNVHTATVKFIKDGEYAFGFAYMNKADTALERENITWNGTHPEWFVVDTQAPTGSVVIGENIWAQLLEKLTFGLYTNDKFEVTANAADTLSPVRVQYHKVSGEDASKALTAAELEKLPAQSWENVINTGAVSYEDITLESKDDPVVSVDKDEQFVVYLKITDYAGNVTYLSTDGAIVDTGKPGVTLKPVTEKSWEGGYNTDVAVEIAVTEELAGLKSVTWWVESGGETTQSGTLLAFEKAAPSHEELIRNVTETVTVEAKKNNDSGTKLSVKAVDNAGNETVSSVALDIDITAPTVAIRYDRNDPKNGKYFDGTRVATVVITERANHFDTAAATAGITVTAVDGSGKAVEEAYTVSDWVSVGDIHTATVTYSADANYTFAIGYTDKAGNKATQIDYDGVAVTAFTVDCAKPQGSVAIGENIWEKLLEKLTFGLYTNDKFEVTAEAADLTSPVTVEHYKVSGDAAEALLTAAQLDAVTGWSEVVDGKVLTVSGNEQFVVYLKLTDYAGNYTYISTDGAIVENTPPAVADPVPVITVTPEQPMNGFYNGDVRVDIAVADPISGQTASGIKSIRYKVLNMGKVTQEGSLYGFTKAAPTGDRLLDWEGSITVDSKLNNSNDVKIQVTATDNAGNTASAEAAIQVDITAPVIHISYNNNAPDSGSYYKADRTATIVVTERNFKAGDVAVTIENTAGAAPTLSAWTKAEGTGNGDDTTYTATVTYDADGDYTFAIAYTDLAGNRATDIGYTGTNPTAFTIDKTAPALAEVTGLEKPSVYAGSAQVTFTAQDAVGLKRVRALVDGQPVLDVTEFDGDGRGFQGTLTLTAREEPYTVRFIMEDLSGNVTDTGDPAYTGGPVFHATVTVSPKKPVSPDTGDAFPLALLAAVTAALAAGIWLLERARRRLAGK